jgi:RNA polymerase sigma-70 factor (ECF subfamily)
VREETRIGGEAREFPPTRWTLVRSGDRAAFEELLATYWKPLYFHVRRKGRSVEDAKDAVQDFVAHLLDGDFRSRLDASQGRFRAYLRASLDHFLINEHAKRAAQKRGGGVRVFSLDVEVAERELGGLSGDAFDRAWAIGVMQRSMERLRREFESGDRRGPYEMVREFFGATAPPSYADAGAKHGMSAPQVKAFLHRARERFREIVREEVGQIADDAEGEITQLLQAMKP